MNPLSVIPAELHWLWSATWQAAVLVALVLLIQGLGRNLLSPSSWIRAVHWFNPLIWLLLARIRSDRELACDALAMTKTARPDRGTYGRTVLKLLEQLAVPSPVPGSVGVLEDRRAIERRVQSIIRFRPHQRFPWAVAALWIALAGLMLTDGRSVPADEPGTTPSEQQLPSASVAGEDSTDHLSPSEPAATVLRSPFQMRLVERKAGANTEPMSIVHRTRNGQETVEEILHVRRDTLLDHTAIASATAQPHPPDPWGNPLIQVQLTEAGAQRFAEVTRANIGRLLAVVVDGRLLTAPRIAQEIRGRRLQITGSFSAEEAAELAGIINAAVILAHPLTPVEAGHLAHPTANTPQANDTLSVAGNHSPTLRWLIQPGSQSLLRIEGTSSMHDWQVESRMMEGYIELGADALTAVSRAPMERMPLKAKLQIPVRSLKSVGANGKAFSAAMDEVMYHLLRETNNPEIVYTLTESIVAGGPDGLAPWRLDTKGNLLVAGVKKEIATTAKITFADDELRFRIETKLKMSDFNVDPPVVKTLDGAVQLAYDEVSITLEGTATPVATP